MKRLIVIGAGGFGREVLGWAQDVQALSKEWEIGGFLDDNPKALDGLKYDVPIIGGIKDYMPQNDDYFVLGIGSPRGKLAIAERLMQRGAQFISLIHPTAVIGNNIIIGRGCVICPFVTITCDVKLGDFVSLNIHSVIGHDAVLGDGCTLSVHAVVTGHAYLGKGVYVANHGSILPQAKIGDFARVGAGSVVLKSVKPETTVMGVPAKRI